MLLWLWRPPPPTNKTEATNACIIFYLHTTNSKSNLWKKEMFKSEFYSTVNLKRRTLCLNNKWNTSSFTVVCTTVAAHCSTHIHSRSDLSDFLTGCTGWQLKQQKWAFLMFGNPENKNLELTKMCLQMDFSVNVNWTVLTHLCICYGGTCLRLCSIEKKILLFTNLKEVVS